MNFPVQVTQSHIARAALQVHAGMQAFDHLIAGAAVRAHFGVRWSRDLIVDRNVVCV
jgi:hypothetical protein